MTVELAEPFLRDVLATFGLDVEYVRASGNTLFRRTEDGGEVPVLDMVGGYGSLIFGHHHPELVATAKSVLDAGTPVLAQFSRRPEATAVAAKLDEIARRELEADQTYSCVFANSGAEAIEVAAKYAELDRVMRLGALASEIEAHVAAARQTGQDIDELLASVAAHNAEVMARSPVFLALEGGFHGKLMGSVQLTHNEVFRIPFGALGTQARFVPLDQPGALKEIIDEERRTLLDIVVHDGVVTTVERDCPVFSAFLLEPIQGEGGVRVLTAEFAREIQDLCREVDCPIIVDEIQTGMGRTGSFFASAHIGLHGDFYALAKGLGGGIAKISAMLVRKSRYRGEFELLHSSTFAKDSFSSSIALKVVEMLEADGGKAYELAKERGARLTAMLAGVQADFPDVVKEVRGKGLFVGLEFHDQSSASSVIIRDRFLAGTFGYALAGYLLHRHGIRALPTASATGTLRFQPSIHVTDAEIDQLETALRGLATVLRNQDGVHLVRFLVDSVVDEVRDFRVEGSAPVSSEPVRTIAYLSHLAAPGALRKLDPSLGVLSDEALHTLAARLAPLAAMAPLPPVRVTAPDGAPVDVVLYPLLLTTEALAYLARTGGLAPVAGHLHTIRAAGYGEVVLDAVLDQALHGATGDDHQWLREIATLDERFGCTST